jgi:hypothetical protein
MRGRMIRLRLWSAMAVGGYVMSMKMKEGLVTWLGPALTARELSSGGMIGE